MLDFTGKVVLITGGGGGIGRATALAFAKLGAQLVIADRDVDLGNGTVEELNKIGSQARFVEADVTSSQSVKAYIDACMAAHGRIDCFYNNAGFTGGFSPMAEYDEDVFDQVMAVNVKGVFLGLKHVIPIMLAQKSGAIVNTASIAGLTVSMGQTAYVTSKHAVIGLTKMAAMETAAHGVRVNAVCPGPVETRMMRNLESQISADHSDHVYEAIKSAMPTGRYSQPEEIADAVVFLCSDMASNVTASQLVVDGGFIGTGGASRA